MTKSEFKAIVEDGINRGRAFMAVKISTEGHSGPEVIVNGSENFKRKLAYYDKVYNNNMEHIKAKKSGTLIKIEDVLLTGNLNDLNWFAY